MKIDTTSYSNLFFMGCLFLTTISFLRGFWSVVSYPTWWKYSIIIFELLLLFAYLYRSSIKRFLQKHAGEILFISISLVLILVVYRVEIHHHDEDNSVINSVIKYVLGYVKDILATLIGIWVIYLVLRPKLKIYPTLALIENKEGKLYGKVLIQNTNFTDLFDLRIVLQGCFLDESGCTKSYEIEVENDEIAILRNKSCNRNENSYAWHTSKNIHDILTAFDYIRCRVIATHSMSGIHFVTEQHFKPSDWCKGDYNNKNKFIST